MLYELGFIYTVKEHTMIGYPKYKKGDTVSFIIDGRKITGCIEIIDAYGTFWDDSDVSYDIMVESENTLYKHIKEHALNKDT